MIKHWLAGCVAIAVLMAGVSAVHAADKKDKGKKPKSPAEIMAKLDKDANKSVSESEFIGKKDGEKAAAAKKRFARLDKNADGNVTLDELQASPKKGKKKA